MSVIDLKFTTIKVRDGFPLSGLGTPLVNNGAGYTTTTTTMLVDGITGSLHNGDQFTIASHTTVYTITAHTETSGNTTSITFTPGLVNAAVDDDALHFNKHELDIRIGEGTLTFDEKKKIEYKLDRGRLFSVREGDQEALDVRFDIVWEFLTAPSNALVPTIEDALKGRGVAAGWATSGTDPCEPYAVDIIIQYDPPCIGVEGETITLPEFRWEGLNHDAKAGTVAVTGKCNRVESTAERA